MGQDDKYTSLWVGLKIFYTCFLWPYSGYNSLKDLLAAL